MKKGTNFLRMEDTINYILELTFQEEEEKILKKLRANTDPNKGILKSGRPCACYIKLYSPNNIQKTKTALGLYLCLQPKFPLRINKLQQSTSQLHTFFHIPLH